MEVKEQEECVVSGVLVVLLRVSRCAGLAPLHMQHLRNGAYRLTFHRTIHVIASIILTVFHLYTTYFTFKENIIPYLLHRINKSTLWALLSAGNKLCILVIMSIGVYGGPKRLKTFMNMVHQIQEVITHIQNPSSVQPKMWKIWFGVISIIGIYGLLLLIRVSYTANYIIFICHLFAICLLLILVLQFVFFNITIYLLIKTLNNGIRELYDHNEDIIEKPQPVFSITQNNRETDVSNALVKSNVTEANDFIKNEDLNALRIPLQTSEAASRRLEKFAYSYLVLSNVVYQIYKSEGGMMLLLICHQVISICLVLFEILPQLERPYDVMSMSFIIIQFSWLALHIIKIIILIEPSYYLQQEMGATKVVLSQLMCRLPISNPLRKELDSFLLQFLMQQPACAPMGICTFNRSLIATIAAVVTSLLIIIMQFHLRGSSEE